MEGRTDKTGQFVLDIDKPADNIEPLSLDEAYLRHRKFARDRVGDANSGDDQGEDPH